MEIVMLNDEEASNVIGGGGCVPDDCVPNCVPDHYVPDCDKRVWKIAVPIPRIPKISLCVSHSDCHKPKWGKSHSTCEYH